MTRPTRLVALLTAALVWASLPVALPARAAAPAGGRFIVTLKSGVDSRSTAAEYRRRDGVAVDRVYTAALNGFAGDFSSGALGRLQADDRVARLERDGVVRADATTQAGATWSLDRIDQRNLPLSTTYSYEETGAGVTAYIVDTGIRASHSEFGARASIGTDVLGGDGVDCNGHGTHVAGTVGGSVYGVAKNVRLVAVRVLDCGGSGTWSGVIAGLDWIAADHTAGVPAVANMSLGGGASASVDDAVRRVIADGVTMAVAAGNGNDAGVAQNACNYSPARVAEALTVGATTNTDTKTPWSNYGSCVDLFAPGSSITSAWIGSDTATNVLSGTSMATPLVAGAAALYLEKNPDALPAAVAASIKANATQAKVASSGSAPNDDLLYIGSEPETATISVSLTSRVKRGTTTVTGSWTDSGGTVGRSYDVFVNTAPKVTVSSSQYSTTWTSRTTVTYRVCRSGSTSLCSALASIAI